MSKIGISSQVIQAGKYKQVGTADRAWNKAEKKELNKVIQDTYMTFVHDVAKGRGLNPKNYKTYADAHIFTASQAKKVGLVDSLGVMYDAKNRVAELAKVDEARWNKEDKFDKLIKKLSAETATMVHIYFPELSLR
jgi:protease-4